MNMGRRGTARACATAEHRSVGIELCRGVGAAASDSGAALGGGRSEERSSGWPSASDAAACQPHVARVSGAHAAKVEGCVRHKRKKEKLRALVGVRAMWVAQVHRSTHHACPAVARWLLDAARADCGAQSGVVPQRAEVAWAPWVSDVSALAVDYCGGAQNIIHYA